MDGSEDGTASDSCTTAIQMVENGKRGAEQASSKVGAASLLKRTTSLARCDPQDRDSGSIVCSGFVWANKREKGKHDPRKQFASRRMSLSQPGTTPRDYYFSGTESCSADGPAQDADPTEPLLQDHEPKIATTLMPVPDGVLPQRLPMAMPPEVREFLAAQAASSFACRIDILDVSIDCTIADAVGILESEAYIFARKGNRSNEENKGCDAIFSRMTLLQRAMDIENLHLPFSAVTEFAQSVETAHSDDTLDTVFGIMLRTGHEEVIVMDEAMVVGVISCSQILGLIRPQEMPAKLHPGCAIRRCSLASQNGVGVPAFQTNEHQHVPITFDNDSEALEVNTKQEARAKRVVQFSKNQLIAQDFCKAWCGELLIGLCVMLDITIGIADFATDGQVGSDNRALIVMFCMLCVYFYERVLRLYGFWLEMLRHPFWLIDCLIVDISVVTAVLLLTNVLSSASTSTMTMIRVLRMLRILLIIRNLNLTTKVRQTVSSQKARYREGGFDLDLTYVNKACIAMSLPAIGAEASYRNPISEVQRFFATHHQDHFLIFNLCKERSYGAELFDGRVWKIDVEDHNPPLLSQIVEFLEVAGKFMKEDPFNCIAVHCKGGKGRTGTMICAWLMYSQFETTAESAMEWFASVRTGEKARASQGVSQPSQQRYVRYAEQLLAKGGYHVPQVKLHKIVMRTCPHVDDDGGCNPWFTIEQDNEVVFDYRTVQEGYLQMNKDDAEQVFELTPIPLMGDIRIIFFDHDDAYEATDCCGLRQRKYPEADDLCFFFWFHTGFITSTEMIFKKEDVDVACHDDSCKVFMKEFEVELFFDRATQSSEREIEDLGTFWTYDKPSNELLERTKAMKLLSQFFQSSGTRQNSMTLGSKRWPQSPGMNSSDL